MIDWINNKSAPIKHITEFLNNFRINMKQFNPIGIFFFKPVKFQWA